MVFSPLAQGDKSSVMLNAVKHGLPLPKECHFTLRQAIIPRCWCSSPIETCAPAWILRSSISLTKATTSSTRCTRSSFPWMPLKQISTTYESCRFNILRLTYNIYSKKRSRDAKTPKIGRMCGRTPAHSPNFRKSPHHRSYNFPLLRQDICWQSLEREEARFQYF
jgi:hypothetical protein